MSKFFITNKRLLFNKVRSEVERSEYDICFTFDDGPFFSLSTKKLAVDNINGIRIDSDFTIVTGTMIWKEGRKVDSSTLSELLSEYDGTINSIRDLCIGNYAASIFRNNTLTVFGEPSGFYNIFYYYENGTWLLSNSLYDMYSVLHGELTMDEHAFTEFVVQNGILWGDTIFNQIKRLRGLDHIECFEDGLRLVIDDIDYPLLKDGVESAIGNYKDVSSLYATKTYKAFGTPTIAMTGGMDARMLLASYLSVGLKPDVYYGKGDSFITNTYDQDGQIVKIFKDKFGLKMYEESWATPEPLNKYWDKYLELYGFYYMAYGGSDSFFESILNNPNQYFILGEGGEMVRNQKWIDERTTDYFTLDEYIDKFYIPDEMKKIIVHADSFVEYIKKKYLKICEYYHLNPDHINNEDIFILTLERRKTADSATINTINFIKYDSAQMTEYKNLKAARVDYKETAKAKFMLRCHESLCSEILDVPVFSHCQLRRVDKEHMCLETVNTHSKAFIKITNIFRSISPTFVLSVKKLLGKDKMSKHPKNEILYTQALEICEKYDHFNIVKLKETEDNRVFTEYASLVYALKDLK